MNWKFYIIVYLFGPILSKSYAQNEKKYHAITIAFYNLENLFDYEDDPLTYDDDRTPFGKDRWTETDYKSKLHNMAKVLAEIGSNLTNQSPAFIGVCEVENRRVLEDLLNTPPLREGNYNFVHYESPDRRGVDVALLYKKGWFIPLQSKAYELKLFDTETQERIYTRDQLLVSGKLYDETIHIIINHWPSRRGGEAKSAYKRLQAARLNKYISDSLFAIDPYAKIISMGDFNDDPIDESLKKILETKSSRGDVHLKQWFNPMESMFRKGLGSLAYADSWNLFDQILITNEFLRPDYSEFRFYKAGIYNPDYLKQGSGKFKGYPFKSHSEGSFTGGYSDHFPVYLYLIKEKRLNQSNH